MTRALAAVVALAALLHGATAIAFESECLRDLGTRGHGPDDMISSICKSASAGIDDENCPEGLGFARGILLGEHTFLTYQGMTWAGVPPALLTDQEVLRYYASGDAVPGSGTIASIAASAPSRMRVGVNMPDAPGAPALHRPITIAEFGQATDGAYSLADFLLGNEHCPVSTQSGGTFAELEACHSFRGHISVTNSTHFSPQTREMSHHYHGMALQTADRCLAMFDAFNQQTGADPAHPLQARADRVVRQCIKEALAIEAVSAHFQEDAWSTGHMWERWGTPLFPLDENYVANHIVGIISGIIHGWRSIARDTWIIRDDQNDQMCLPGPRSANDLIGSWQRKEEGAEETVTFSYADEANLSKVSRDPLPGGGDCYVLPCSQRDYDPDKNKSPRWALYYDGNSNQTTPLFTQRVRMMTCLRRGFEEVYERLPALYGALAPSVDERYLDPGVPRAPKAMQNGNAGAQADACWMQRVTNRAMSLSGRFGGLPLDVFDASEASHLNIEFAEWRAGKITPDDARRQSALKPQRDRVERRMRAELVEMAGWIGTRAADAPDATDLAELSDPVMQSLVGVQRNSDAVSLIRNDEVPYLEHSDRFFWHTETFAPCNSDEDCRSFDPRSYCDPGALKTTNASAPGCVLHDTAVARSFREAEGIYWCGVQDLVDIDAARHNCKGKAAASAECAACVELVTPRLRNGCEPSAQGYVAKPAGGGDNRAMCDLLVEATTTSGAPRVMNLFKSPRVYWPHKQKNGETPAQARDRAALEACLNGDDGADGITAVADYGYVPTPPATALQFPVISRTILAGTCGQSATPTHWYRLDGTEVISYLVQLVPYSSDVLGMQGPEKLKLDVFAGPACDPASAPLYTGTLTDMDTDGVPDSQELTIAVPSLPYQVCLRVTAADESTRTTWALYITKL